MQKVHEKEFDVTYLFVDDHSEAILIASYRSQGNHTLKCLFYTKWTMILLSEHQALLTKTWNCSLRP